MKRPFTIIFAALMLLVVSACKKGEKTSDISVDEVATLTMNALSADADGIFKYILIGSGNARLVVLGNSGEVCGNTYTENSTGQGNNTAFSPYNSTLKYASTLNCNGSQYDNIVNKATFTITGDGPKSKVSDAGTVDLKVDGLNPAAASFIITGTYNRTGAFTSKLFTKATGTSVVSITALNVVSNKSNNSITSCTANINISGSTSSGNFNYSGTILYNAGGIVALTIGATNYNVDVFRSTVTRQ